MKNSNTNEKNTKLEVKVERKKVQTNVKAGAAARHILTNCTSWGYAEAE